MNRHKVLTADIVLYEEGVEKPIHFQAGQTVEVLFGFPSDRVVSGYACVIFDGFETVTCCSSLLREISEVY